MKVMKRSWSQTHDFWIMRHELYRQATTPAHFCITASSQIEVCENEAFAIKTQTSRCRCRRLFFDDRRWRRQHRPRRWRWPRRRRKVDAASLVSRVFLLQRGGEHRRAGHDRVRSRNFPVRWRRPRRDGRGCHGEAPLGRVDAGRAELAEVVADVRRWLDASRVQPWNVIEAKI